MYVHLLGGFTFEGQVVLCPKRWPIVQRCYGASETSEIAASCRLLLFRERRFLGRWLRGMPKPHH
jgi:hypothetical protein